MKQTMKRTLAIVLAALTALCLLPTAFGEDAAPAKTVEIVVDETKSDSSVYTIMESGSISLDFDKTMVLKARTRLSGRRRTRASSKSRRTARSRASAQERLSLRRRSRTAIGHTRRA